MCGGGDLRRVLWSGDQPPQAAIADAVAISKREMLRSVISDSKTIAQVQHHFVRLIWEVAQHVDPIRFHGKGTLFRAK